MTLIDADLDVDIGPLQNGDTLNLSALPTRHLNVRANTSPSPVGSVRFALDVNSIYRTENTRALFVGRRHGRQLCSLDSERGLPDARSDALLSTEWQHIGNQIDAAMVFARANVMRSFELAIASIQIICHCRVEKKRRRFTASFAEECSLEHLY